VVTIGMFNAIQFNSTLLIQKKITWSNHCIKNWKNSTRPEKKKTVWTRKHLNITHSDTVSYLPYTINIIALCWVGDWNAL
jgi:hypothetical protein